MLIDWTWIQNKKLKKKKKCVLEVLQMPASNTQVKNESGFL